MKYDRISEFTLNKLKEHGYLPISDKLPLCIEVELWMRRTYGWSFEIVKRDNSTFSYSAYSADYNVQIFDDGFPLWAIAFDNMIIETLREIKTNPNLHKIIN